ncbi:MAG: hypothetical protein ACE37F_15335 [Nannocystaceae bacterium]|nr:kelch motif-containing protein [bacterium]
MATPRAGRAGGRRTRSSRGAAAFGWALGLATLSLTPLGCSQGREAVLQPLWGCGLEGEALTAVRVRARGDLPVAEADSVLLDGGRASLEDLPDGVDAVTVEGLFGESVVLAVGRTPRLPLEGTQPVYFSPPDQLCPVEAALSPRDRAAVAVAESGVILAAGGVGQNAELFDQLFVLRDDRDEVEVAQATLERPSVGHTLTAIDGNSFVLVGGATGEAVPSADAVQIDVDPGSLAVTVHAARPISLGGTAASGRAFHGAVALPDGRVLVQGGCAFFDGTECEPSAATVLRSGFYVRHDGGGLSFEVAPSMLHPRYDHMLLASRDGVVFAVGGRDDEGANVRDIEVLLPGTGAWTQYGPALLEVLGGRDIVGAALLEGGLIVLTLSDGTLWRVDQNHVEQLEGWCTGEDAPCFLTPEARLDVRRSMVGLWGERVMVGGFVLHAGILGRSGADAVDLSAPRPGRTYQPPGQRIGGASVMLADGTVLTVGGRVPASGSLANPVITRFRPLLDGPDEGTPDVSSPVGGALVLHDRAGVEPRISAALPSETLLFEPDPARSTDFAATWVHFRGFRSRRFAVEGAFEAFNGTPELHAVFSRGAIARTELAVGVSDVRLLVREADGSAVEVTCSHEGLNLSGVGHSVGFVVSPRAIDVRVDGEAFARCPWSGDEAVAVGLGAVGAGTLRASGLRLSRN